jgi:hypothetical protein
MNTIDQIISSVAGESLDYKKYKNDLSQITRRNGVIVGGASVPYSKIDLKDEKFQTRVLTTDRGHVASLASDISENGLERLPVVSWNEETKMFNVLSGHHRTKAVNRNNQAKQKNRSMIPVLVAEFDDEVQREFFLQSENNHRPLKVASKADAVLFLQKLKTIGYFDSFQSDDGSKHKNEAKRLLKEFHGKIIPQSRNGIIKEVWEGHEISKIIMYESQEFRSEVKELGNFAKPMKSGEWLAGGTCIIRSVPRAVPAALVTALHESIKNKNRDNSAFVKQKVRIFTYFDKATNVGSLKQLREDFIEEKALFQREVMNKTGLASIETIQFLDQIYDGEEDPLSFVWCNKTSEYVAVSEEVSNA